jgi:hypothetical protein
MYFIWPTRCNLYSVLYYYQRSTCFGRFFRPSSGAYKTVCAALSTVMLSCCLPLVWMGWNISNPSTTAVNSRKAWQYPRMHIQFYNSNPSTPVIDSRKAKQYPRLHIQFYKLLMTVWKPARNMYRADNNKEHCISCISLVIQNTHLAMHGSMNVKLYYRFEVTESKNPRLLRSWQRKRTFPILGNGVFIIRWIRSIKLKGV